MKSYDLLDLAVRNVKNSRLRNALTTLGIAVGIMSLVATASLGIGLQSVADKRLKKSGIFETVFVTSKADWRNADRREGAEEEKQEELPLLDEAARQKIAALPHVVEVVPEIRSMSEIVYNDKSNAAFIAAIPPSAKDDESLSSLKGQFFSSATADEAIVQQDFAKRLAGSAEKLIGKDLTLRFARRTPNEDGSGFSIERSERTFRVVGIIEQEPFGGMRMISRARVFIPTAVAEQMNLMQMADTQQMMRAGPQTKVYTMLTVKLDDPARAEQVQDAIKKMNFGTYSFLDASKSMRRFFAILDGFLLIFGSLALAVASLAIVNTLVMAVLERRREIGIMKALGASDGDVRKIFFAEAAAMGAAGGALGVLLGWAMGRLINMGTNLWLARNKMPGEDFWFVPWWLVVFAIAFAIGVSIVSGLYPASRAAKLDPVQALRYE